MPQFERSRSNFAPDFLCGINDECQLVPLNVFAHDVAFFDRGKTALWTQAEFVDWRELRCRLDASENIIALFQFAKLRRD